MNFENAKKTALSKVDKSTKGEWDKQIVTLLNKINANDNYYTTSSCAGRILVLVMGEKKTDAKWLLTKHGTVDLAEVMNAIKELPEGDVWLKMEPLILHICCKDLESAQTLLSFVKQTGLKRSGITGTKPKIMLEIMGNEMVAVPIIQNRELIVEKDYLLKVINIANLKLEKNYSRIVRLEEEIKNLS